MRAVVNYEVCKIGKALELLAFRIFRRPINAVASTNTVYSLSSTWRYNLFAKQQSGNQLTTSMEQGTTREATG
jgi:hypothetical protein